MPNALSAALLLCASIALLTSHAFAVPVELSLASPSNTTAVGDAATSKISTSKITFYNKLGIPCAWDETTVTIDGNVYRHDDHPDTVTIGSIIEYSTTVCRYIGFVCHADVPLRVQFKVNEPSPGDDTYLSFIWLDFLQLAKAEMSHHIELVDVCVKMSEMPETTFLHHFEYWRSGPGLVWDSTPTKFFYAAYNLCSA